MVSVSIMPTERSMPAVVTTSAWATATKARSVALLAAVCTTLAVKPAGWFGDVDEEHDHEDADGHQRAALLGQPVAPVLHAISGREGGGAVKGMGTLGFSGLESGWKVAGKWLATF